MLKADRIDIIESHPNAEQPYNLVKEVFISTSYVNGVPQKIERSNVTTKNIRPEGHKIGVQLTKAEIEKKRISDLAEEQDHAAKLLKEAVSKKSGNKNKDPIEVLSEERNLGTARIEDKK